MAGLSSINGTGSSSTNLNTEPLTILEAGGNNGFDIGFGNNDAEAGIGGAADLCGNNYSLGKEAEDDKWAPLLEKLVVACKVSCASKLPIAAMDQEPRLVVDVVKLL